MHESSKEANNQYLLEIGLEEMPAGMILPAVKQLKIAAEKSLESNPVAIGKSSTVFFSKKTCIAHFRTS